MTETSNKQKLLAIGARVVSSVQQLAVVLLDSIGEVMAICRDVTTMGPPNPMTGPARHVGEIIRCLRQGARLARWELSAQTDLSEATIKNLELGRHKPTVETIRKLLRAPCMSGLPGVAKSAGLDLGLDAAIDGPKARINTPPDPTNQERLGALVRRLREAGGLTRAELSKAAGISAAIIRNLEVGRSVTLPIWRTLLAHPSMRDLPELAKRQGITLDFLETADNGGN